MKNITPAVKIAAIIIPVAAAVAIAIPVFAETAVEASLREQLKTMVPNEEPGVITQSQIDGIYEAHYRSKIWYITEDGKYAMDGALYDMATRTNLTELALNSIRGNLLRDYGDSKLIVYPPTTDHKYTLTVVTDIDCVFCRKLHGHIEEMRSAGIEVRYLLFPRAGMNSESYHKAVSVWCSDDSLTALTQAKQAVEIPKLECDNPVSDHMQLVRDLGVRSTPIMFRDDGKQIRGYYSPDKLLPHLAAP